MFAIRVAAQFKNLLDSHNKAGEKNIWGKRAEWVDYSGVIDGATYGITVMDHPGNPRYPTYWHARGYGLFAANPLGEKIFTQGKSVLNLKLKKGESIVFRYRILIQNGNNTPTTDYLNQMLKSFSNKF
jgi:hypothetical protein